MKKVNCCGNTLENKADFEDALDVAGFGRFHYQVITACAISVITLGFQNGLTPYMFPSAQCELNLTSFELGLLNIVFLIGATTSCFLWGPLSDSIGRRKVLVICHFANVIVTLICVTNTHSYSLTLCRFLNGFFSGGPGSIIFSYIAEFQPKKYRGPVVCCCGLFFTFSMLLLPLIAYGVLQLELNFAFTNFIIVTPWRLYLILLVMPELLVAIWIVILPESPKFYVGKGDLKNALKVLQKVYSINTKRNEEDYPIKILLENSKNQTNMSEKQDNNNAIWNELSKTVKTVGILFKKMHIKATILTCAIMFCNMFGAFGLGLWLPEFFIRFEQYQKIFPNATVTVRELSKLEEKGHSQDCVPSFDSKVMLSTVAIAISSMVYNVACSLLSSRVKMKKILLFSMVIPGLCAGSLYFLTSSVQNLIISCIFQATMITANMAVGSVGIELFPTKAAGVAMCLMMAFGRIGGGTSNAIFGYYMDTNCAIPIFSVAVVVLLGGLLCAFIPTQVVSSDQIKSDKIPKNASVYVIETKFNS